MLIGWAIPLPLSPLTESAQRQVRQGNSSDSIPRAITVRITRTSMAEDASSLNVHPDNAVVDVDVMRRVVAHEAKWQLNQYPAGNGASQSSPSKIETLASRGIKQGDRHVASSLRLGRPKESAIEEPRASIREYLVG